MYLTGMEFHWMWMQEAPLVFFAKNDSRYFSTLWHYSFRCLIWELACSYLRQIQLVLKSLTHSFQELFFFLNLSAHTFIDFIF